VCSAAIIVAAAGTASAQQTAAAAATAVRGGPAEAPVQLTLFCSLESAPCARLVIMLGRLLHERPQSVAVTFRHAAPPEHERSPRLYAIVLAAARQEKGWDALDTFFINVDAPESITIEALQTTLNLDPAAFAADLADGAVATAAIEEDAAEAARLGVTTTPALFLNGRRIEDLDSYDTIAAALARWK
jgi:protein-disulfide isomerase